MAEQPQPTPSALSVPIITAIVGGVVTIITVALQFVVAPMLVGGSSSKPQPAVVEAAAVVGASQKSSQPDRAGLFGALPRTPLENASIDRALITLLGVQRLTEADVRDLNCWQLRVLRNASPAFRGHVFQDVALDQLFRAQSWYRPAAKSPLSGHESANISFVKRIELDRSCKAGGV